MLGDSRSAPSAAPAVGHRAKPPTAHRPRVGVVGGVAGGAFSVALALSGRLDRHRIVKILDPKVTFEGKGRPLGEVRD